MAIRRLPHILLLLFAACALPAGAVEVVVNPSISTDTISRSTLRAIFNMRTTQWPDGRTIKVFVLGEKDPLHRQFTKQILGVFPHQLRRAWKRRVFSGTGQAPVRLHSQQEMLEKIATTPGAIGYLSGEQIDDRIKTLKIQ